MKRWLWLILALVSVGFAVPAFGAGVIIIDEGFWWPRPPGPIPPRPIPPHPIPPWPRPVPPVHHVFAPLEIRSVKVNVRIRDQISTTTIEQDFYNPNDSAIEGTFVFPVPRGAHLDKFTMDIDGKPAEAELVSAEKARHIYEDIVRKLKDPALLEYAGRDVFKVRIFPTEPHGTKRIHLSYTQLLKADSGLMSYALPSSDEKFSSQPIKSVSVKVDLENKRALKTIYSPSHAVEIKWKDSNHAVASYEASDKQPAEPGDFVLYFAAEKDEIGLNLLTYKKSGEDGYFLLLASPGTETREKQVMPKDVAFVVDTSGSMVGTKLQQAKQAMNFCVESLNPSDRFEIIRFSTETEPLFEKLVEANSENREKARHFIDDFKATGGTAIDDALKKALALRQGGGRPFVVIFLTDGRPTMGTTDEDQIVQGVQKRGERSTRVFCFGVGTDVNTHLLDRISEETRAFSQYVLPSEDLEIKVSSFFSKIKEPVLANPSLAVTGEIHPTKMYPSPLPDVFKGEQLVVAGRYSRNGDAAIIIDGSVNGEHKKFTYDARFDDRADENEFIPRLWATRRVGYLLDEIRLHGENAELRDEVSELARKYGIVTPYTAYLIVEDEARRNVPTPLRSMRDFEQDRGARQQASENWQSFKNKTEGDSAVAGARYGLMLRSANAPASVAANGAVESRRALGLADGTGSAPANDLDDSKARLVQYSENSRFVAGKNFFQNGSQWIDSEIQKQSTAKRVRVAFGTTEYFDLVAKHPQVTPWLTLGTNVEFVFDGVIYEIHE
jgi:Ca-activated chloride channel family protein